jgi:predicted Holliday junction resolvase-like endonuclease
MALQMLYGIGVFSLIFYSNAKNIPTFLTGLLILILIFIVAIQQDQIHNIRKELKEINLHLDKNTEKFQGRTVNNEMSIQKLNENWKWFFVNKLNIYISSVTSLKV